VLPPDSLAALRVAKGDVVISDGTPEVDLRDPPVNSWLPRRRGGAWASRHSALRDLIRSYASWVILLALAIDALALLIEPALLLVRNTPPRAALAAYMATVGLSAIFSMAAAIPIAAV
jgi:hypothetical protein